MGPALAPSNSGAITMQAPNQYPPLKTSFVPPQEVQDWTSVPPPDTY
jgi:hypothetical protein